MLPHYLQSGSASSPAAACGSGGGGTPTEQLLPSLKAANLANTIVLNTANLELTLRDQFFNMYTMYVVVPLFQSVDGGLA